MENPCNICILKVTCTAVCPEKENYKALLRTAIKQNLPHPKTRRPAGKHFKQYEKMKHKNETETMKISIRRFNKGDDDDPIRGQVRQALFSNAKSTRR